MSAQDQKPEISVLMSVYNGERFLAAAVDSILEQDFNAFEFIIINDGSTDGSTAILRSYAAQNPRIKLIEQKNKGLISALNTGLEHAQAPLIARMDADDIALPARLSIQKRHMDAHSDTGVLGSAIIPIDEHNHEAPPLYYPRRGRALDAYIYKYGSPLAHPTVMMRRDVVLSEGGYREAFKHAEDYDLWLRLHKITTIENLTEPLLKYRQHDDKVSVIHAKQQARASVLARYIAQDYISLPPEADMHLPLELSVFSKQMSTLQANKFEWDVMDVMASSLLMVPHLETLEQYIAQLPATALKDSTSSASRVFLKFAATFFKNKQYANGLKYISKAFCISPHNTLNLLSIRVFKKLFSNR